MLSHRWMLFIRNIKNEYILERNIYLASINYSLKPLFIFHRKLLWDFNYAQYFPYFFDYEKIKISMMVNYNRN
jgi:hypothetical protein